MDTSKLRVSPAPHLKSGHRVRPAMLDVALALLPVSAVSVYVYGMAAVQILVITVAATLLAQLAANAVWGRQGGLGDGSALVTGLLLALCFQAYTAWPALVIGAVLAIFVAKELMGGLGWNRFNPALFGRAGVYILAPLVTALTRTFGASAPAVDVVTGATPMVALARGLPMPSKISMLLAHPGGALAEVSALAVIAGGAYLLLRGHLKWRISVGMIAVVALAAAVGGRDPVYHILGGGLLLGALFMATDWVSSPVTPNGQILFGLGAGLLTALIRLAMPPAEGVAFAILIMNAFAPALDRATAPLRFGDQRAAAPAGRAA